MNRLGQGTQLVITLLQLILVVALCYHATTSLEPEFAITTDNCLLYTSDKGTDDNRLVEVAIQADETDATTIRTTVVWLQL